MKIKTFTYVFKFDYLFKSIKCIKQSSTYNFYIEQRPGTLNREMKKSPALNMLYKVTVPTLKN